MPMPEKPKNRTGRPKLPPEKRRTARLSIRTFPDVEAKAKRVGTAAVENAVRAIEEPPTK